ncbi:hypothetical protein TNCV_4575411 [Trichonephila clavipes]|nr:hypothetical protein TNCV_4575411 [Trichonephila clavipes]
MVIEFGVRHLKGRRILKLCDAYKEEYFCGYHTISYLSVYATFDFPPIDIAILHNISFRENLSASSISNYDCILSPFSLPHPSERNAINIIQLSDKNRDWIAELVSLLLCSGVVLNPSTSNLKFVMNAQFICS